MTAWTRQEKLDALRGVFQLLGLLIMIACIVMTVKYRDLFFHECTAVTLSGDVEKTGLWGNCSYINRAAPKTSPQTTPYLPGGGR